MIVAAWFLLCAVVLSSSIGFCVMIYRFHSQKEVAKRNQKIIAKS